MKNWESLFREHILERGHNYFISGTVSGLNKTSDGYTALVEGTENYEVEQAMITADAEIVVRCITEAFWQKTWRQMQNIWDIQKNSLWTYILEKTK